MEPFNRKGIPEHGRKRDGVPNMAALPLSKNAEKILLLSRFKRNWKVFKKILKFKTINFLSWRKKKGRQPG